MYHAIIYIVCVFVAVKTLSYSLWSFKTSGVAGGMAVLLIAVLCTAPLVLLER